MLSIPIKENDDIKMYLKNMETGEILEFGTLSDATCEVGTQYCYVYREGQKVASFLEPTLLIDVMNPNQNLNGFLPVTNEIMPRAYDIEYSTIKQRRIHKKKRINKKWMKKYGFVDVIHKTKGWKLKNYSDGSFEFVR